MNDKTHLFDEESALQALEQLRDQIQRARSRREQKVAEFEAFLRSNRAASQAERSSALDALERAGASVAGAARTADRAGDPVPPRFAPAPARGRFVTQRTAMPRFDAFDAPAGRARDPFAPAPPIWGDRRYQIGAGIAVMLVLILLIARPWRDDPAPSETASRAPVSGAEIEPATPARGTTPAPQAASAAAEGPGAPAPAGGGPLQVELTTLRPVWMRVVVDGARRVERQVPANQTLAFGASRAIVLRAGDAGAVRVSVGGVDRGVLGRDGQVVNRTFRP